MNVLVYKYLVAAEAGREVWTVDAAWFPAAAAGKAVAQAFAYGLDIELEGGAAIRNVRPGKPTVGA
jgi:hypothetical protein